jgi:hypothetical protein
MKRISNNEQGLVSIIIVTVLILVISIITITFASLVQRERRQALDQQQSTQARLAAEAVIDEKVAEFRSDPDNIADVNTCGSPEPTFNDGESDEIQTTCFIIDTAPGPLEYDEIETSESIISWLDAGSENLDKIVITWQNTASATDNICQTRDYGVLPTALDSNEIGMLRFDLTRIGSPGDTFSRDTLREGALSGVLHPKQGGAIEAEVVYEDINAPDIQPVIFGSCDTAPPDVIDPYLASAIIDLPANDHNYVLRLRGIYRSSQVKIIGYNDSGDTVAFRDAQISVEATARVNDVVQRIQVRVPSSTPPREILPNSALHVTNAGLCKMIRTEPGSTIVPGC